MQASMTQYKILNVDIDNKLKIKQIFPPKRLEKREKSRQECHRIYF